MAHQASENLQKQTTPLIIGRFMDFVFSPGAGRLVFVPVCELRDRAISDPSFLTVGKRTRRLKKTAFGRRVQALGSAG
jgi:hypothetical protein